MVDLLQEQLNARQQGKACALVTLVKTEGPTPRNIGSKMLVFADGSILGTIGGGVLEQQVIADAVECVRLQGKGLYEYSNKTEDSGPACGGKITVYMEAEIGAPRLVVCGAGHVGGEVMKLAHALGYHVTAVDTRSREEVARNLEYAHHFVHAGSFAEGIAALDAGAGAFYLVSTYGHAQDAEALAAVLKKEAAYVGMMGSPGKIAGIQKKLREQGYAEQAIASVYTPIGLDIGGETPPEIAVSILAEMQMVRYKKTGRPMRESLM